MRKSLRLVFALAWLASWLALALGALSGARAAAAAAPNDYLEELIARARALKLAEHGEWRNLIHYKPRLLWPGIKSLNDDPAFFNSPDGAVDPEAELVATLEGFFTASQQSENEQHSQCRFIARYRWLNARLGFDSMKLPPRRCEKYEQWIKDLNPASVTLIFPAAYLNNPASMYGHTLLRIDARDQDERTRLLAYAVNYSAVTTETVGIIFAAKGLFGGYRGQFSIAPYYLKVREYNDLENRDIWEYELNLTPEEIERLLAHLWELGPSYFDYYFLDENCSYHLLSLLEVARPGVNLTDRFRWWAIPSDTVHAVTEEGGFLRRAVYRPARATIMHYRLSRMNEGERELALAISEERILPDDTVLQSLPEKTRVELIELAYEHAAYQSARKDAVAETLSERARRLLLARSQVDHVSEPLVVPPPAVRPEQGHPTARLGFAVGKSDRRKFVDFEIRPTYHDLLDPEAGYTPGAQIQYFALTLRRYEDEVVKVYDLKPLDIVSISPRSEFFKPWSWRIDVGWTRLRLPDGDEPLVFRTHGGAGGAWALPDPYRRRATVYAMMEGTLDVDNALNKDRHFGLGPALGLIADLSPSWRVQLNLRAQYFRVQEDRTDYDLSLEQRISLDRTSAMRIGVGRKREFERYWNHAKLAWQWYF